MLQPLAVLVATFAACNVEIVHQTSIRRTRLYRRDDKQNEMMSESLEQSMSSLDLCQYT